MKKDDMVREIYGLLIGKSWEDAALFEPFQNAWLSIASILGVKMVRDNGYGKVIWKE